MLPLTGPSAALGGGGAEGEDVGVWTVQQVGGAGMGNLFCSFVSRLHQNEVRLAVTPTVSYYFKFMFNLHRNKHY